MDNCEKKHLMMCSLNKRQESKFICAFCPAEFPNFKELMGHLFLRHRTKLHRYEIKNLKLRQVLVQHGDTAERLININGWDIKDCVIKEIG